MNKICYLFVLCLLFILCACTEKARLDIDNNCLIVLGDSSLSLRISILIDSTERFNETVRVGDTIDILSLLQSDNINDYSCAYKLANSDGLINIMYTIVDAKDSKKAYKDSVFDYKLLCNMRDIKKATLDSANFAPLQDRFSIKLQSKRLKKWLFVNDIHKPSDSIFRNIMEYQRVLYTYNSFNYEVTDEIPYMNGIENLSYKVESSVEADYYYLLAASNENEILEFVKTAISNDFQNSATSLDKSIHCYHYKTDGSKCIFLIAIYESFKYEVIPLGVICFDYSWPGDYSFYGSQNMQRLDFERFNISIITKNVPKTRGSCSVSIGQFSGYGPYYNVPYDIRCSGDIKCIRFFTPTVKTYYPKKSGYETVNYSTRLNMGDNRIKYEIEDKRGNITRSSAFVSIHRESTNGIYIDNDIDVW